MLQRDDNLNEKDPRMASGRKAETNLVVDVDERRQKERQSLASSGLKKIEPTSNVSDEAFQVL